MTQPPTRRLRIVLGTIAGGTVALGIAAHDVLTILLAGLALALIIAIDPKEPS